MEIPVQHREKSTNPKLRIGQLAKAVQPFTSTAPTTAPWHAGVSFQSPAMLLYGFNTCRGGNLSPTADEQQPGLQKVTETQS